MIQARLITKPMVISAYHFFQNKKTGKLEQFSFQAKMM